MFTGCNLHWLPRRDKRRAQELCGRHCLFVTKKTKHKKKKQSQTIAEFEQRRLRHCAMSDTPPRCFSFLFCLTKPHTYRVVVKKNFKKWTRFSEGLAFVLGRRSTFLRHSRWALFLIVSNATASPNFSSRAHAVDPFFSHNFLSLHLVCWITHWIHCLWILIGFTGWYCFLILLKLFSRKDKWS